MMYMLDTNIIIYAKNDPKGPVYQALTRHDPSEVCISSVTLAELEYGISKSSQPDINRLALMLFLARIQVLPFGSAAARDYGNIRCDLESKGSIIGANDMLIAAHARSADAVLVTNNLREFNRVEGLKTVNWADRRLSEN